MQATVTKIYGNEKTLKVLEVAFKDAIPALLVGQTGTGKNTILRHIAKQNDRTDIIRLNLTGETTVDDLIGHYQIKDRSTVWQDGSVTQAVRNGNVLILDEVNAAQPEVLFALQSLLDDDRSLTLTSHDNSVVPAHENFRIFATMNPNSGYAGTKDMNKAFMSRFGLVLEVEYASAEAEMALVSSIVPDINRDDLLVMLGTARQARHNLSQGMLTYPLSTRDVISWAVMTERLGDMTEAFQHTIVAKAGHDSKEMLKIYQNTVSDSDTTREYRENVMQEIQRLMDKMGQEEKFRSLVREDADKAVKILEQVQRIAHDREIITRDVTQQVKDALAEARAKVKSAAEKLKADAEELEAKHNDIYQQGYDEAQAEIYEKLGLTPPAKAEEKPKAEPETEVPF